MNKNNKNQEVTFIDVFAGCGGLSLGLLNSGWKGLFAIERNPDAFKTLHDNLISVGKGNKFSWPDWLPKQAYEIKSFIENYRKSLQTLNGTIDMIVGGPPCQGFSSAGRRDPHDPRNQLVKSYLELVDIINPKIVLIENVRGITQDFKSSITPLEKINYSSEIINFLSRSYTVSSKILDMSLFGVPQKRHRFFIVAIKNDLLNHMNIEFNPFALIEKERLSFLISKGLSSLPITSKMALSDLEISRNGKVTSNESHGFEQIAYTSPMTSYQTLLNKDCGVDLTDTRLARHSVDIVERFKKIIIISHATGRLNVSLSAELKASFGLKKCAIRVLDPDSPSPTITSMPDDLIHYSEPRALTVRENARLQSFPDWFSFKGKYTTGGERRKFEVPRFTQVANAVPPLAAEAIGLTIKNILINLLTSIRKAS